MNIMEMIIIIMKIDNIIKTILIINIKIIIRIIMDINKIYIIKIIIMVIIIDITTCNMVKVQLKEEILLK